MEKSSASLVIRQMQINTLWILKSQNSHHEKSKGQQMLAGVQRKRDPLYCWCKFGIRYGHSPKNRNRITMGSSYTIARSGRQNRAARLEWLGNRQMRGSPGSSVPFKGAPPCWPPTRPRLPQIPPPLPNSIMRRGPSVQHRTLRRETVTLTCPGWHLSKVSKTTGAPATCPEEK